VRVLPAAEALRQIAPGNAGAVAEQHRLDEQAVVGGDYADGARPPGQQVLNPAPLVVSQGVSAHRSAFPKLTAYESKNRPDRNRENDR